MDEQQLLCWPKKGTKACSVWDELKEAWPPCPHPNMQRFLNPERPLVKRMTNPEPPSVTADENETVLVEITPERQCTIM